MELSGIKKRLLSLILRESVHSTFGQILLSHLKAVHKVPHGLAYEFKVPPSLCRIQKSHPVLSNAATLALFDELSSNALLTVDRQNRGGLSVHLVTEVIKPAPLHDNVVIITTAEKVGRTLGFLSMEMRNVKGDLLARGKHIKYMPMGWVADFLAHPKVIPFTLQIYEKFIGKMISTPLDRIVYEPREVSDSEEK
eukprot:scaffold1528_cov199-Ochromonas_danica.AAC.1